MEIQDSEYVVSLITLNQGAAVELFDNELKKILRNIADPQTEAGISREITLKVKIKPVESRKEAAVHLSIQSKQAPQKPATSTIFFGKVEGEMVAAQSDPNQARLFDTKHEGNVKTFEKGQSA